VGQTVILHRFSSSPHQQGSPLCYRCNAFVSRCLRTCNRQIHNHRKTYTREVSVEQARVTSPLMIIIWAVQSHSGGYSSTATRALFLLLRILRLKGLIDLSTVYIRVKCFPCESAASTTHSSDLLILITYHFLCTTRQHHHMITLASVYLYISTFLHHFGKLFILRRSVLVVNHSCPIRCCIFSFTV
jgi:hypothetical protein